LNAKSFALVATLVAFPLAAQRIDDVPHAAATAEMAPATLAELAMVDVAPPPARHDERSRPALASKRIASTPTIAQLVPPAQSAAAPPVTKGFRSSYDPLPQATTGYDPADASGAVGPHHVVGAFNNSLAVHGRDGNELALLSIYQFWHDPNFPDIALYDPRVLYDAANDRWVLVMLGDSNYRLGTLFFAVTATGDPTGPWRRFRIAASSDPEVVIDFTRVAMTADQIVITVNEYIGDPNNGADVFTIAKSAAYSAADVPVATKIHSATDYDFTPVSASDSRVRILTQDADSIVRVELLAGRLRETGSYSSSAPFELGPSDCAQLGSAKALDCGDSVLHYAFLRDGVLWIVQKVVSTNGRSAIAVWKSAGLGAQLFVIADAAADYAYPSLAVNRLGTALVGYSVLDASMYPSAAYRTIDSDGNVSAPAAVKSGEDWYSFFRWGDYSTTVVDPADDTSFWTLQSYSTPPFRTSHATWGTWWSYVQVRTPQKVRAVRH
jgi:hypothetical protein